MRARVSAFRLVLFAVGFLFLRFSAIADTIVLPEPFFTNQFTSVEAWVQLETSAAIVLWEDEWDTYYYQLLTGELDDTLTLVDVFLSQYETSYNALVQYFDYYQNNALGGGNRNWFIFRDSVFSELDSVSFSVSNIVSNVSFSVDRVGDILNEIDTLHRTNIVSSVSFGQEFGRTLPGGGCECPDYRDYLSALQTSLSGFRAEVNAYLSWLEDFRDGWQSIISSDYTSGALAASTLVKYFAWDWSMSVTNDITALVTNSPANPLWVSLTNNYPLLVELAPSQPPFSVCVTNLVDVNVVNFDDLVFMLTNSNSVEERSQAELDFAESKLRDQEEPDEEDDDLEDVSLDDLDEIGNKMQEIMESYKEMFDTNLVPTDMPNSIMIHRGFQLGSIHVSSMHWNPDSKTGKLLRGMRSLFRAIWFVVYMVLLYYCAAVDMLIAGSLLSCCFGVIMGDSGKITRGISSVWRLFVSMLGVSPASSE